MSKGKLRIFAVIFSAGGGGYGAKKILQRSDRVL